MIFDMHCHTKEGSPDALVSLDATVKKLKSKGYNGMLVSDHNSYNGYKSMKKEYKDFVVLRGIEYDSVDGGHLLIILPSRMKYVPLYSTVPTLTSSGNSTTGHIVK